MAESRVLTEEDCKGCGATSRSLHGEFGAQIWVLADGSPVAGMPRPGRYVWRLASEAKTAGPFWERDDGEG